MTTGSATFWNESGTRCATIEYPRCLLERLDSTE